MKEYKDFQAHNGLVSNTPRMGGEQWKFKFDNGYGASVITVALLTATRRSLTSWLY